ncbi:Tryptophan--tRNA ligase, mitochondrial [Batrachochytrium dendrobatidis]|nr:Tryptophan--tRNA ligase, mitochondrial [Batrachochytrium dendrobatidis]KAK5668328.1 Tryptophan--tRNA ligase, mitochondrial [Batrachochytrium dendrobatidis]
MPVSLIRCSRESTLGAMMLRQSLYKSIVSNTAHRYSTTSLSSTPKPVQFPSCTLSGIQPTGIPHIGNYIGALRNWVDLQNQLSVPSKDAQSSVLASPSTLYMIADMHALTIPQDPVKLRANVRDMVCVLLACGIKPDDSILFRQSRVPQHTELGWLLFCQTPVSWVSRMHQWKTKLHLVPAVTQDHTISKSESSMNELDVEDHDDSSSNLNVGLLSYPILQAADILLYRATKVPVGDDQAQHLNLTSMIARRFNSCYNKNVFPIPQSIVSFTGKRIMSLKTPTSKMSKSDPVEQSRINLDDSADQIRSKIRRATTDSIHGITYDPQTRPGVANLLQIWMALETSTGIQWEKLEEAQIMDELAKHFGSLSNEKFKMIMTDVIVDHISPIRNEIIRLKKDPAYIDGVLEKGETAARFRAEKTMQNVRRTIGLT